MKNRAKSSKTCPGSVFSETFCFGPTPCETNGKWTAKGTEKKSPLFWTGKSSFKAPILGSMLIFKRVCCAGICCFFFPCYEALGIKANLLFLWFGVGTFKEPPPHPFGLLITIRYLNCVIDMLYVGLDIWWYLSMTYLCYIYEISKHARLSAYIFYIWYLIYLIQLYICKYKNMYTYQWYIYDTYTPKRVQHIHWSHGSVGKWS